MNSFDIIVSWLVKIFRWGVRASSLLLLFSLLAPLFFPGHNFLNISYIGLWLLMLLPVIRVLLVFLGLVKNNERPLAYLTLSVFVMLILSFWLH